MGIGIRRRKRRWLRARATRGGPELTAPELITWESEARAIAWEAAAWQVETGGDLFGLWTDRPLICLATKAGPGAVRDRAHFRLDVDYLRAVSAVLASDWGLRYFGDWHSHHRLGLTGPSWGDRRRIRRLASRNSFVGMAEIIVTFEGETSDDPVIRLHPWLYERSNDAYPSLARLLVLPGLSPVREALLERGAFPDQKLAWWVEMPSERIRGTSADESLDAEGVPLGEVVGERVFLHVSRALEEASGAPVERHPTPFGWILAIPVNEGQLVAIAVGGRWPHEILEVDWIDRGVRQADPVQVDLPANLLRPDSVVAAYWQALKLREAAEGKSRVD